MVVNFTHNIEVLQNQFNQYTRVTIPAAYEESAKDIVRILTNVTRKHIPAMHRLANGQKNPSTGRLWSGWGEREQVRTNNPNSTPADNVAEIKKRKGRSLRFHIIVGTNVPYAKYVDQGRPFGQGRHAYEFTEKGKLESKDIIMPVIGNNIQGALDGTKAKRRFNAARQLRTAGGKF